MGFRGNNNLNLARKVMIVILLGATRKMRSECDDTHALLAPHTEITATWSQSRVELAHVGVV